MGPSRRFFVKVDDLLGSKQTIFESKQRIWGESGRSYLNSLKRQFFKADDPHQYIRMSHEVNMRHNESY